MSWWYVYILGSTAKDFVYVGSTNCFQRRVSEHNQGLVKSTKAYRPLELLAYIAVATEQKAKELERYLKTGSGKAILRKRILANYAAPRKGGASLGKPDEA